MEKENILELLDIYSDMVEKQDEIIRRLGKIIKSQATQLQLLKNDNQYSDLDIGKGVEEANDVMQQYDSIKKEIEP